MTQVYEVHYNVTLSETIQIEACCEEEAREEVEGMWKEYSEGIYNCEILEERVVEIGTPYVPGEAV
jgi:hypothetical protein